MVKREIEVRLTPSELAELFCAMYGNEQAEFFEHAGRIANDWPGPGAGGWCGQSYDIVKHLGPTGRATIATLAAHLEPEPTHGDPREGSVKFVRDCDNPNSPPVCYEFRGGAWRNRDGWIDWAGGECPVLDCVRVDVKLRDGRVELGYPPGNWNWQHVPHLMRSDPIGDIIAYRVCDA